MWDLGRARARDGSGQWSLSSRTAIGHWPLAAEREWLCTAGKRIVQGHPTHGPSQALVNGRPQATCQRLLGCCMTVLKYHRQYGKSNACTSRVPRFANLTKRPATVPFVLVTPPPRPSLSKQHRWNARVMLKGDDHRRFMTKQRLCPSNTGRWFRRFSHRGF